ncbi:MAG: hypothetical protein PUD92_01000 [Clostridiales bacterium]|nr:hypothetical protein [Clostridiales bacterium]
MNGSVKATADSSIRGKALMVIAVYAVLFLFCFVMAIYDISASKPGLGIPFAIVAVIFAALSLLKLNSVFGTYIKVRDNVLYMKSWANDFLPYDINGGFLSDLKPAKTKLAEIPADELSVVLVGTKDFIKRNVSEAGKRFIKTLYPYEHSRSKRDLVSSMDMFYVETIDGECSFMCIYGYDPEAVIDVIGELYDINPDLYVRVGSRAYKRYVKKLQSKIQNNEY